MIKTISAFALIILLSGCFPIKTNDAEEAYGYWARSKPPKEIDLINGQYYQSPHFSLEYQLFLELNAEKEWFNDFVAVRKLEKDTLFAESILPLDRPEWFAPTEQFEVYHLGQKSSFSESRYYYSFTREKCFIFETIGM